MYVSPMSYDDSNEKIDKEKNAEELTILTMALTASALIESP